MANRSDIVLELNFLYPPPSMPPSSEPSNMPSLFADQGGPGTPRT